MSEGEPLLFELDVDVLESFEPLDSLALPDSLELLDSLALDSLELDSLADESLEADESESPDVSFPFDDAFEERESVTYQPLPLKTIPTG